MTLVQIIEITTARLPGAGAGGGTVWVTGSAQRWRTLLLAWRLGGA
jgi:hypothetical protein